MNRFSSHPEESEIVALLRRMERKEESALAELHRLFSKKIFAFALHRLGHSDEAESVVIDTLYEIWKDPSRFRGESTVQTWILGIARFKALSLLRARSDSHEDIDSYAELIESDDPGPLRQMENKYQEQAVKNCMSKLKSDHRECLHLVFYQGLSLAEVAEIQAIPENTVKTRLFYARKNIKFCLQQI
jgi:RNA polymerase sigma-70 factor (ECF subfamily)